MRSCAQIPPVSFSSSDFSLDCLPPSESVGGEIASQNLIHLDIRKADFQARLVPRSFEVDLPWLPNVSVRVGDAGEIRSSISIRDNQFPLMLQSLVTFHDIHVDGPWDMDIWPDRVLIGEYGGLHFLFGASSDWYERMGDPKKFLNLWDLHCQLGLPQPREICGPLGWEEPSRVPDVCEAWPQQRHDATACCEDIRNEETCIREDHPLAYCRPPEYASIDDPRLDLTITPWIPVWLTNLNGRLPEAMNWLDLLHRILSQPPQEKSRESLQRIFEKITFADGRRPWNPLDFLEEGEAQVAIQEFSLSMEPRNLHGLRLESAEIRSGTERLGPKGELWPAGLVAQWDFVAGIAEIRANLDLDLALQIPGVGDIRIQTPVFFSGQFKSKGDQLELVPGSFSLECPELKLEINGDDTMRARLALNDAAGEFQYQLQGDWNAGKSKLEMNGSIPVGIQNERYQWQELKDDLENASNLKFIHGEASPWEANLYLNTFRPAPFVSEPGSPDQGIRLEIDLFQGEKPILEGGRIQFQRIETPSRTSGRQWLHFLQMEADYLDAGEVVLKNSSLNLEWDQIPNGPQETHFRVSRASFHANTTRSEGGRIRGPVSLEVNSRTHPLEVIWNPRNQDIQIKGLEASLNAQGISLPSDLLAEQRRERIRIRKDGGKPKARIEALGVDGKIQGHFHFNLKAMKGEGDLKLVGDREGDVYFLNQKGEPVRPPLISRTQWRFRRFDKFHWKQGFVLGAFRLFTRVNTMSLARFGHQMPFEADVVMTHRDVMFKPGGIDAANRKFYRRLLGERKAEPK